MYPLIEDLPVVYEDDHLLVVNKPSGMLSQPGKHVDDSVLTRVRDSNRDLHGPVLVHRLDMDTSGLLLLAKNRSVHRALQQQFEHRQVGKRYRAVLEQAVEGLGGRISLPIRLDIDNRPMQIVCDLHGKVSTTLWRKTEVKDPCRVTFYPLTGRTHQLRVHAASALGLGQAIRGDRLYGTGEASGSRLMLHADYLKFEHPHTQQEQCIFCPEPF